MRQKFNIFQNGSRTSTLKNCQGFTLVELVSVIVVLGIAIPALVNLLSSLIVQSDQSVLVSNASYYAQEKMEEIISDKKSPAKGFDWVTASGRYSSDTPASGFSRSVIIESGGHVYNGISYAFVQVVISHSQLADVVLTTWLTDY